MGAEEKLVSLEYDLFCEVRNRIAAEVVRIQKTAKAVAKLIPSFLLPWWQTRIITAARKLTKMV